MLDAVGIVSADPARSVQFWRWNAFWGQRYACVLDPDGNQIDLFASL